MRHVVFRLSKERYALPLSAVREVVVPPALLSRVPRAPAPLRGIINLRGRVVTLVDLRGLLGLGDAEEALGKLVLLEQGRRDLGLLVTEVEGIEPIERVSPAPGTPVAAVRGLARLKGLAVTILDPAGVDSAVGSLFTNK